MFVFIVKSARLKLHTGVFILLESSSEGLVVGQFHTNPLKPSRQFILTLPLASSRKFLELVFFDSPMEIQSFIAWAPVKGLADLVKVLLLRERSVRMDCNIAINNVIIIRISSCIPDLEFFGSIFDHLFSIPCINQSWVDFEEMIPEFPVVDSSTLFGRHVTWPFIFIQVYSRPLHVRSLQGLRPSFDFC